MSRPRAAITGASSGIGEAFAKKLARSHDLLLIARRCDRLDAMAAELTAQHGTQVEIIAADLSHDKDLAAVAARIATEPHLDLFVNNAGLGMRGLLWESDPAALEQMHRLNVSAVMRLSHAALSNMIAQRTGCLINVASVAGFVRRARNAGYGASKAWVVAFTESLYLELDSIQSPVRVQILCPGYTLTEFHDRMNIDRMRIAPRVMWLRADFVVEESIKALRSQKLFVVPGWRYRLVVNLSSILPIPLRLMLERAASRRKRRSQATA